MKKSIFFVFFALVIAILPSIAVELVNPIPEWGSWSSQNGRLYQNNIDTGLAKIHWKLPQRGELIYDFNVRYETGAVEDLHGGFGVHVFVDSRARGASWGDGSSYLLWLNYDASPESDDIPVGLSAQIYRSEAHHRMTLIKSISLKSYERYLTADNADAIVPIKFMVNGQTGKCWIEDPTQPGVRYSFSLGNSSPIYGDWVALRTNGISLSFDR